jgi:hypothetical protein
LTNQRRLCAAGILAGSVLTGCASKSRSYARDDSGKPPAAPSAADSARGRAVAAAMANRGGRATLSEGSAKMHFPIEALQAREEAAVIVSFIVMPNGRVDRESRTIVYLDGHPLFAQAVCDFLLEARVKLERPSDKPAFASLPTVFRIRNLPKPPVIGDRIDEMVRRLDASLYSRTQLERESWIAERPSCSALKKRDMQE